MWVTSIGYNTEGAFLPRKLDMRVLLALIAFAGLPIRSLAVQQEAPAATPPSATAQYDVVILDGRLMDPATSLDAVRNIGIRGGKIATITASRISGKQTINAGGLVVSPGFIDLHSHGQTPENYAFKARDGVTTALEMEAGVWPVLPWYAAREGKSLVNYGATVGHIPARMAVMHDSSTLLLPHDAAVNRLATDAETASIREHIEEGLNQGALGVGFGLAYTPLASREEVLQLFRLAASRKAVCYAHVRNGGPVEPGVVDAVQEVIADAAITGASLHIVHITSMGLRQTPLLLSMIRDAKQRGMDVTTEAYPYTAGMTDLASAIFAEGWEARQGGITYHDLQWIATGERLTAETFAVYRKQGGMVVIHSIPEDIVRIALADPQVLIASDGVMENGKGHPRGAGTYARVLGYYVRDQHVLPLMEALRKMTILPARRAGLANKGRLALGADADITVFDPARVSDQATFEKPAQYSTGIPYVLVNGVLVVKENVLEAVFPGQGIRRR
jgi:N-acyl-D-aspartate/D-glutamate deacylase